MKKCCFTGHRPDKLPWGYNESGLAFLFFKRKLNKIIIETIKDGCEHFISGMAIGTDMIAAELVLKLKKKHPNIKLECAIPCFNQELKWKQESKRRYKKVLNKADKITYVSERPYFDGCMQKRNKYMVNNSNILIAVYDGVSNGGTKQTIDYALKRELNILYVKV